MDSMTAECYTGLLDCLKAKMTSHRFMREHRECGGYNTNNKELIS